MSSHYHSESAAALAAKSMPSLSVAGLTLAGIHLQDWVLILTLIYTSLVIVEKLWRWYTAWRERDED